MFTTDPSPIAIVPAETGGSAAKLARTNLAPVAMCDRGRPGYLNPFPVSGVR